MGHDSELTVPIVLVVSVSSEETGKGRGEVQGRLVMWRVAAFLSSCTTRGCVWLQNPGRQRC